MTRFAVLLAVTAFATAPAIAGTYSAIPATTPDAARIVGKDIVWTCSNGGCRGSTEASRPIVLCQDLAKRAGHLASFTANGVALTDEQLGKCNASAKGGKPAALATAN